MCPQVHKQHWPAVWKTEWIEGEVVLDCNGDLRAEGHSLSLYGLGGLNPPP